MQLKSFANGSSSMTTDLLQKPGTPNAVRSSFLWRMGFAPIALMASSLMASTPPPVSSVEMFPAEASTATIGSVFMENQGLKR